MKINQLYQSARKGDKNAENELFSRLTTRFRVFITLKINNKQDAEEIMQDSLAIAANKYKSVELIDDFVAWALKILEYSILNYYRLKGIRRQKNIEIRGEYSQSETKESNPLLTKRIIECFRKVNKYNNRYARILNLRVQGYQTKEICEKMNLTPTNFYTILSRAKSLLLECLEKENR